MKKYLMVMLAATLIAGCGGTSWLSKFKRGGPGESVTALEPVQSTVTISRLWSRDIGAGSRDRYQTLFPVVHGGRVYAADGKGNVSAYDADSGRRVWRTELKQAVSAAIGLGAGLVLVGTPEGTVIALEASTGEVRWRSRLSSEILSPPAAATGMVVARTVDGKVFGLAAADGQRRWIYERGVPSLSLRGTSPPLIYGGGVLTGFASGKIVANDLRDGHVLWEMSVARPRGSNEIERLVDVDAQAVISGGALYTAAYQGNIMAVSLQDGRLIWVREISSHTALGADSKNVYLVDEKGQVLALDRQSGATRWKQDKLIGRRPTGPISVGDFVAVGDFEGYLHLLAKADGRFAGRIKIGGGGMSRPAAQDSTLYAQRWEGALTALQISAR